MKKLMAILVLFSFLHPFRTPEAKSPWPMFRHDTRHTGRSAYTGPAGPVVAWTYAARDSIASSPSIGDDGTIYVGMGWSYTLDAASGGLLALNPDGTLKWTVDTGRGVFSSPAVTSDGRVFFGSLDRNIYGVRDLGSSGEIMWTTYTGNSVYSSPTIGDDGTVYIGTLTYRLYAMSPSDGVRRWAFLTGFCIFSSPALDTDGRIYIGSKDEHLHSVTDNGNDYTVNWSHPMGEFYDGHLVDSSPSIGDDGTIYVGVDPYGAFGRTPVPVSKAFWAINPDGSTKWWFEMQDGVESSPAIGPDGTVYVGSYDGNLYAIRDDGDRGTLLWKHLTGGWVDASPTVDGAGTIYVGSRDSTMYAFNPDGTVLWEYDAGSGIQSSVTIDDRGYMYFGSIDGILHALGSGGADAGVLSIDMPPAILLGSGVIPSATVANHRSETAETLVTCRITGPYGEVYTATVDAVLGDAGRRKVTFPVWEVADGEDIEYSVTVSVETVGDARGDNDRKNATILAESPSDVADGGGPGTFAISQNHPNPFNPSTTIPFSIPEDAEVVLTVHSMTGQRVATLVDGFLTAGQHSVTWDASGMSSGLYIGVVRSGLAKRSILMTLLK